MRQGLLAFGLMVGLSSSPAAAEEHHATAKERFGVEITLYNQDLALVRERRRAQLQRGENLVSFRDVSARIQPETVLVVDRSDPSGIRVVEQQFDFNPLTPDTLLRAHTGRTVEVIRTHPTTGAETREEAVLLSSAEGTVLKFQDRVETGVPGRLAFPRVPEDLHERPTLKLTLHSDVEATRDLELQYLSGGLSWRADYVAQLSPDEKELSLAAWATLTNTSGNGFDDARIRLVAGDVRRVGPTYPEPRRVAARLQAEAAAPAVAEEALFAYHLYTLERRTSLADNQTKQVALLPATALPVEKEYLLQGTPRPFYGHGAEPAQPQPVTVRVWFENSKQSGPGQPLPEGVVRVYKQDSSGAARFIGENRIAHTPVDQIVRLDLGQAFDVTAERTQTDFRRLPGPVKDRPMHEAGYRIRISNAGPEPVEVRIREPVPGDWTMVEESRPHSRPASGTAEWLLPVPAAGAAELTYRVRYH